MRVRGDVFLRLIHRGLSNYGVETPPPGNFLPMLWNNTGEISIPLTPCATLLIEPTEESSSALPLRTQRLKVVTYFHDFPPRDWDRVPTVKSRPRPPYHGITVVTSVVYVYSIVTPRTVSDRTRGDGQCVHCVSLDGELRDSDDVLGGPLPVEGTDVSVRTE